MTWNCYLTIFKAESPVHIGYKQIGILKTTRYYITGKAMWGAITANLTRALFDNPNSNDYQDVGNFVKENIKTTYFFPAIKGDEKSLSDLTDVMVEVKSNKNEKFGVFLPRYEEPKENNKYEREDNRDVGIKFSKLSKEEFEQIFVGSFVSTALDATTKTAEEGSLHEFEFIKNRVKIVKSKEHLDVYWIGYVFAKEKAESKNKKIRIEKCEESEVKVKRLDNSNEENLTDVISLTCIGGERNDGLGKLKLVEFVKNDDSIFNKFKFESDENVIFRNLNFAISHVKLDGVELELGEIEPLVGLEWSEKGVGQSVSRVVVCLTPGSKVSGNYELESYGLLIKIH